MKILLQKDWKYTFFIDDKGAHILTVLCGSVGIYEVEHTLTSQEIEKYQTEGEHFIDILVNDILYHPSKYGKK